MQQIDQHKISEILDGSSDLNQNSDLFDLLDKKFSQTAMSDAIVDTLALEKILNNADLQKRGIDFSALLQLAWYFGESNQIRELKFVDKGEGMISISLVSDEFDILETTLYLRENSVKLERMRVNKFRANKGIGSQTLIQMILYLQQQWFEKIFVMASRQWDLDQKYKSKGYSFFPKFWFLPLYSLDPRHEKRKMKILEKIQNTPEFCEVQSLDEFFTLKDENGEKVWLEYWKKIGIWLEMEFDLSKSSSSRQIFEEYLTTYLDND